MHVTTDEDRAKIKAYLKQAAQTKLRIQSEQADLRDILMVLKTEYDITPSLARKVITIMDKNNMPEVQENNDNLADLYEIAAH